MVDTNRLLPKRLEAVSAEADNVLPSALLTVKVEYVGMVDTNVEQVIVERDRLIPVNKYVLVVDGIKNAALMVLPAKLEARSVDTVILDAANVEKVVF